MVGWIYRPGTCTSGRLRPIGRMFGSSYENLGGQMASPRRSKGFDDPLELLDFHSHIELHSGLDLEGF